MQDVIQILNELLQRALEVKASDIHIEPREEFIRIRYRIDGLLQESKPLQKNIQSALLSRLKVMVNLDIAENRLPQDGRMQFKKNVDLRVSTIPTVHGEKVVIRVLERKKTLLSLEELGMEKQELEAFRSMIKGKAGMVIVTGPTGAGKTTTLYSALRELNSKEYNVITIEDPVEYQLPSINQVQVNQKSGLSFIRGLRSVLRQDPDVIFVGEIRDLETLKCALQASLTGHLVLSTLHTTDAVSTITRLIEMGAQPYLVAATLLGIIAQRLLRKKEGGRVGIFEVLRVSEKIKGMIIKGESKERLAEYARTEGFNDFNENANKLAGKGEVSRGEVLRVLGGD